MVILEIYVVKSGDTVYAISQRFGVPVNDIIYANQLRDPSKLAVGQALIIPGAGGSYTVKRGDTLYSIARSRGVSLQSLINANPNIADPNRIYPGQRINLPVSGGSEREIIVNGYAGSLSDSTLSLWLPYLTFLSPFSYRADSSGGLTADFSVNTSLSETQNVANLMSVTNLKSRGGFSSEIAHILLTDQTAQDALLNNILSALRENGYYGVNLDFEYVYPFDRNSYNQFLQRLADTLHLQGYILVTALAPKLSDNQMGLLYSAHDYAFHGKTADFVVLMTYEWGYTYGPAMAVSPANMVRRVLDYAVSVMPAGKLLMGMPNYGYDWTLPFVQGTAARPLTNTAATALAAEVGAAIQFDEKAQSPFFRYYDSSGKQHEVWFDDARSIRAKLEIVNDYALAGISIWNINTFYRTIPLVMESMFSPEKLLGQTYVGI